MYGAYVEIAAYNRNWDANQGGGGGVVGPRRSSLHTDCLAWMPTGFFEVPVDASATWSSLENCARCRQDFVLVCEVSEVEGPTPLFTIPQEIDSNYDINTLAEKMMSVDYHGGTSDPFTLTNDTQIVLSTVVNGLHAFVNYFLLYDISARGFVRPMCIAYLTSEKKKLIDYFQPIRNKFLEITRYLKFGNRRLFLQEVELYLDDLLAAKDTYVRRRTSIDNNCEECEDNITIDLLANNITEAQHLLASDKPILDDASAATLFWKIETKLRTEFNQNLYQHVKSFVITEPMHSPKLLPRKNPSWHLEMRSMFELCSWGIVLGLNLLISLQKFYKRDVVTLYMESEDLKVLGESVGCPLMIGTHFLADVNNFTDSNRSRLNIKCSEGGCDIDEDSLNVERNLLDLQSFFAKAAYKRAPAFHLSSDDNLSYEDAVAITPQSLSPCTHVKMIKSDCDHIDDTIADDDERPFILSSLSPPDSTASYVSSEPFGLSDLQSEFMSEESLPPNIDEIFETDLKLSPSSSDVAKSFLSSFDVEPKKNIRHRCILQRCHSRCGVASLLCQSTASHVDFLTPGKAGFGIADIFSQLPSFVHILYSLLVGRPVLVLGTIEEQDSVRSVVQAFDLFVPEKDRPGCVIPWCTTGIKTLDLNSVSLVGFLIPSVTYENQMLLSALKQKVSFVNVSKKSYQGPIYSGNLLSCLLRIRNLGWEDATFISFLHGLLLAYASRVSLYHRFVNISSTSSNEKSCDTSSLPQKSKDVLLSALSLSKDDAHIVQHLAELLIIKEQDI